ncbi:hypothetical protein I9W82_004060 [Candida metapsilosis]|uniref:Uncharacterized protein n=1 Tax=Candida metapsilosis TaxID=273372 RepID=A0A8H7ZH35_9ASCO|nr:hypothetical protein I9W82_004060 [Candida metapsilosis]
MQFTQVIASLALVGAIQAKSHNSTTGGAVSNSTGAAGSNSTGGAAGNSTGGASNSTGGSGSKSDNAANANANIYGGAALVAAAVALLY